MDARIKDYVLVAKPGVAVANLVTAAGGFFLGARGSIDTTHFISTVIGIFLVVASACAFNNCIDRDIDRRMHRTRNRALARGLISPAAVVVCASLMGIAGSVLLVTTAGKLCVAVALAGFAVYVFVYSLFLKRNSVHAVVIGSLAGAAPPLAGYCAAGGRLDAGALILLAIFVSWQIPHSYAVALHRCDDYASAAIPVLPLMRGIACARRHIIGSIVLFMAAAFTLTLCGYTGYLFLAVVALFSLSWLCLALSGGHAHHDRLWAKRLFLFSVLTILVLSIMISIDSTTPPSSPMLLSWNP